MRSSAPRVSAPLLLQDVGTPAQVLITLDLTTRVPEIQLTERGTGYPLREWRWRWRRMRVANRRHNNDDAHHSDGHHREKDEIGKDDCDSQILPRIDEIEIGTGFVTSNVQPAGA